MTTDDTYVVNSRPCETPSDQAYEVRLYLKDEIDPQVYERVKHVFWQAGYSVLVIVQYKPDGTFRCVNKLREEISWYGVEPNGKFVAQT